MSDSLNIKRYRLHYGGTPRSDVRRWELHRVCDMGGLRGGPGGARPQAVGTQRSVAMYDSAART